ncbi:MAG TPA: glycosyltransferase [Planctomycetota bacterium]|nr:glycosyltransferase [Planctomycetota bacterium]
MSTQSSSPRPYRAEPDSGPIRSWASESGPRASGEGVTSSRRTAPLAGPSPSLARRLRLVVFPRGSVRERVAYLAKVAVLETRRGPRGWWTAVRNAGRLLLPPRASPAAPQAAPPKAVDRQIRFAGEVPGLVTVVLPVYNQAAFLGDAIASVLEQTYSDLELIVLSDGSTDGVEAVFDRFTGDKRVRFLVQRNQKLPKALSNAFDFARGEFWTWTSADNLMDRRQLERLVAFLRANPAVDLVFADYYAIDDRGELLRDPAFRPHNRTSPSSPEIRLPRDVNGYNDAEDNYIGPCFLYRGRAGKVLGDYAPELGVEDYDYWLRMNTVMRIAHLGSDDLLYYYRVHDNSLCAQARELGIFSRKDRLLDIDRRRRAQHDRPWRVVVRGLPLPAAERASAPDADARHTVVIVPPEQLPEDASGSHLVAWFASEDREAPYRHRMAIQKAAPLCLAEDHVMADRLALFTDRAFAVPDPEQVVRFAELHARSTFLAEFERDPAQARRSPPRVRLPGDRPLRVLLQVDDFTQGGLEQVVLDLARTLREGGAEVRLVILGKAGDAKARADALAIPVVHVTGAARQSQYVELLRSGVDVVNAHYSTYGADLAAAGGVPFVQTVHNSYVWLDDDQIEAIRRTIPLTAAFTCVSAEAARYTDVVLGVPPSKIVVLPNGIETRVASDHPPRDRSAARSALGLTPTDFVFVQPASIYPPKGQRVAVHALAALRETHPHAKVLFAGRALDPDYHALLRAEIASLGLQERALLLGHRDDVAHLLGIADAFLLPSYWEGWSLAVAEAAVAGLPLVVSEVGAAREQVAIAGGRLVAPPFASITEVRRGTLDAVVHALQPEFVARVAAAMRDACDGKVAAPPHAECAAAFARRPAYAQYVRLFRWLAAGGALASARAWLRQADRELLAASG